MNLEISDLTDISSAIIYQPQQEGEYLADYLKRTENWQ